MLYQLKEVTLSNGKIKKNVLVIEFDDPKMAIVGEFLMADAAVFGAGILEEMEQVLNGKEDRVETGGNRCGLIIQKETTVINDLLEGSYNDYFGLPPYEIKTSELKSLISMWLEERKAFYA